MTALVTVLTVAVLVGVLLSTALVLFAANVRRESGRCGRPGCDVNHRAAS